MGFLDLENGTEENEDSEALMRVAMWCFGEIGVPALRT